MSVEAPLEVNVRLHADDAVALMELLLGVATLVDPDDPDGLPGLATAERDELILSTGQLRSLDRRARYREVERASVARELRRIWATIEGQRR